MLAAHAQIPRIRAERMLEGVQVQSVQHMKPVDHTRFVNRLVDQALGVVAEVVASGREAVVWNGTVLGGGRAIKAAVVKAFGAQAAA